MSALEGNTMRVLVWDLPLRIFHGLLALSFAGAWLSSGDDRYTHVHAFFGYVSLLLVMLRLVWGFSGSRYARFRQFAVSPRVAVAYARQVLRGHPARHVGHNPVGSWAVWLLLAMTLLLGGSGVLVLGAEEQQGPLAGWQDRATGMVLAEWHAGIAWAGLALIAVHVIGVLFESRVHGENLLRAMIDGRKPAAVSEAITSAAPGVALLLASGLLLFAGWYFQGVLQATPQKPWLPYTSAALPANALWAEECGGCHLAYHPSLLPARSWHALLEKQADHFGEDLGIDASTVMALARYAQANEAALGASEAAVGITLSTPSGSTPLRVTELPYWRAQHADIPEIVFRRGRVHGKADCAACHADAEAATFEDGAMRIP